MNLMSCAIILVLKIVSFGNAVMEDAGSETLLSIHLPYSVKKGEIINVPGTVYNFFHNDVNVDVTLDNSDDEYDNINFDNTVITEKSLTKSIRVRGNENATIYFLITPKVIGNVILKFQVSTIDEFYIIHKSMKVVPEGITRYRNHFYCVELKYTAYYDNLIEFDLTEGVVPDSQRIEVGIMGEPFGPILSNLNNTMQVPTGCGEQTMSSLLPNYLLMKYLMKSNRLTPDIEKKLRRNLETGYNTLLNYRHIDGSFSIFGPSQEKPRNGSTWFTAIVVNLLPQLKEFVNVNETIIDDGFDYLSKQQAEDGHFIENGDNFYISRRNNISITCAAVLAFLENLSYTDKYSREIAKGLDFIVKNIEGIDIRYVMSMAIYTLNKATIKSRQPSTLKDSVQYSQYMRILRNNYIVFTSNNIYDILTVLDQDQNSTHTSISIDEIIQLMKYRNSLGGFDSTDTTIVALSALIKFTELAHLQPAKMDLKIISSYKKFAGMKIISNYKNETFKLTKDNEILYQTVEVPPQTKRIMFAAKGSGLAFVQIPYQFNVFEIYANSFNIDIKKLDIKNNSSQLEMPLCVEFLGKEEFSNMALLELSTPSGYVVNNEILKEIKTLERVSHTELKNAGSLLLVYFDRLYKKKEICFTVKASRTHAVAMQKSALIHIYDYYNPHNKGVIFYYVVSKLHDICEECTKSK